MNNPLRVQINKVPLIKPSFVLPFALSVACAASEVEALHPSTSALRAYAQGERQ
jgi:hypothetical protein